MGTARDVTDVTDEDDLSLSGELPAEPAATESVAAPAARSRWTFVPGVLTAALVIMGIGMLVAQIVSGANGEPGPGTLAVGSHLAGAVVGVACYRVALRRPGRAAIAAMVLLPLVTAILLWFFWLSPF